MSSKGDDPRDSSDDVGGAGGRNSTEAGDFPRLDANRDLDVSGAGGGSADTGSSGNGNAGGAAGGDGSAGGDTGTAGGAGASGSSGAAGNRGGSGGSAGRDGDGSSGASSGTGGGASGSAGRGGATPLDDGGLTDVADAAPPNVADAHEDTRIDVVVGTDGGTRAHSMAELVTSGQRSSSEHHRLMSSMGSRSIVKGTMSSSNYTARSGFVVKMGE
jgi:hypothetical protein